ncbi:MAG: hypothetical protein II072_08120 [Clostridia bacterium]|nr:hypothetical protein [Clostridia bacterium]
MCPEDDYDSTNESDDPEQGMDESSEPGEEDDLVETEEPEGDEGEEGADDDLMDKSDGNSEEEQPEEEQPEEETPEEEQPEEETQEEEQPEEETPEEEQPEEETPEEEQPEEETPEEEQPEEEQPEEEQPEEGETDEETDRSEIYEKSEYSDEVNDHISSVEELEVYQNAGLKETEVDGRTCLVREDIDMDYVDPKTGMTNRQLMEEGRPPFDAKTGEQIELHHIGQEYDSPLAELTADSEHGEHYSTLHTKAEESWRSDNTKENYYNNHHRPDHWKARAKEA